MAKGTLVQYIRDRQSTLASGLAALLIIIGGFLVFNYLNGLNRTKSPSITPEATQSVRPQGSESPSTPTAQPPSPGTSTQVSVPSSYTVARGESLSGIAKKVYGDGSRWTEIATANHLANPNKIYAGNVLTIPSIGAPTSLPNTAVGPANLAQGSPTVHTGTTYTVHRGDTLWSIAQAKYGSGLEWYRIDQANSPIARNAYGKPVILTGQVLRIP
jgi:nucleoid-associated protein YgaU